MHVDWKGGDWERKDGVRVLGHTEHVYGCTSRLGCTYKKLPAAAHPDLWKHLVVPRAQLIGTSPRRLRARAQAGAEHEAWPCLAPLDRSTGARAAAGREWLRSGRCSEGARRVLTCRLGCPEQERSSRPDSPGAQRHSARPHPALSHAAGRGCRVACRARPSGFGPGRLNPSPPRVRTFLPRASQAGPLRGPL